MFESFFPAVKKRQDVGSEFSNQTNFPSLVPAMFEEMLRSPFGGWQDLAGSRLVPALDVTESSESVTVTAELPGLDPKEVDISIERNMLTIKSEKKTENTEKDKNERILRTERSYGAFQRSITLPAAVDSNKAKAEFKDGVLSITLPKDPKAQPKRIAVS